MDIVLLLLVLLRADCVNVTQALSDTQSYTEEWSRVSLKS